MVRHGLQLSVWEFIDSSRQRRGLVAPVYSDTSRASAPRPTTPSYPPRRPGRPHSPRHNFSTDPRDPIPVLISVWSKCIAPCRRMCHAEQSSRHDPVDRLGDLDMQRIAARVSRVVREGSQTFSSEVRAAGSRSAFCPNTRNGVLRRGSCLNAKKYIIRFSDWSTKLLPAMPSAP